MTGLRQLLSLAQESLEDGQKAIELEYTFYAKVASLQEVKEKAYESERQEQYLVPIDTDVDGKMRIRKVGDGRHLICTKIKREGMMGQEEVEMEITEDLYNHLKEMGTGGMVKTRYYYKIEGVHDMIWEVDVFKTQTGEDSVWVKVDLEVKEALDDIPEWPFEIVEAIMNQPSQYTEDEKAFVDQLWNQEWHSVS